MPLGASQLQIGRFPGHPEYTEPYFQIVPANPRAASIKGVGVIDDQFTLIFAFEFGPQGPRREFVVTAAGIRDAFPAVARLVDAAPTLERSRSGDQSEKTGSAGHGDPRDP